MSKKHLRPHAKNFYIHQHLTLDEIADLLPVSKTTLCGWSNRYNWKKQRDELEANPEDISKDLRRKLAENVKLIKKNADGTYDIDGDNLLKIAQTIERLGGVDDPLAIALIDMDRYSRFVKAKTGTWSEEKINHNIEGITEYLDQLGKEAY